MALLIPHPPAESVDAFSHGLAAFLSGGPSGSVVSETYVGTAPSIPSGADVGMGNSGVLDPSTIPAVLQAFTLTLQEAANNTGVINPAFAGWNFFAGGGAKDKTVLGTVVQRRHSWKLVAVHYGDTVWEALQTVLQLKSSPPALVLNSTYELRLLAVPGLNTEVFWLKGQTPTSVDVIIPASSRASRTVSSALSVSATLYREPQVLQSFLADIRPLAASLLTMPANYGA
jgi:hypothetical protein